MTELAIIAIVVACAVVLLAIILLGRSIKIDTNILKAEIGRNGGNSAIDKIHKRFDELSEDLRDGLRQITAVEVRVSALELHSARHSSEKGDSGSRGKRGHDGRDGRDGRSEPAA